MSALQIVPIPAFADNYLWLAVRGRQAVVVDPGDAAPVEAELGRRGLELAAILITHHHADHIGGLERLLAAHAVPVYGPRRERHSIARLSVELGEGDTVDLLDRRFTVLEVPGHTLGHIAYYAAGTADEAPVLLCGDTLFSAGCGRLFEGTPAQMHASLRRLAALPEATGVYCTHEYTRANLSFALAVEPDNAALATYVEQVDRARGQGLPSLPSSIGLERRINPFLRTGESAVRRAAEAEAGRPLDDDTAVFAALRAWKDGFRAPAGR